MLTAFVVVYGNTGTTEGELRGMVEYVGLGIIVELEKVERVGMVGRIVDFVELEAGVGMSTVTVEALKLMVEYAVAVTVGRDGVMDKITVLDLVMGGSVSVSMTVVVAGAGTCVTVSTIVTTGRPPLPVAVDPPSTGTTEYVALLLIDTGSVAWLGEKGSAAVNKNSDVKTQSAELES